MSKDSKSSQVAVSGPDQEVNLFRTTRSVSSDIFNLKLIMGVIGKKYTSCIPVQQSSGEMVYEIAYYSRPIIFDGLAIEFDEKGKATYIHTCTGKIKIQSDGCQEIDMLKELQTEFGLEKIETNRFNLYGVSGYESADLDFGKPVAIPSNLSQDSSLAVTEGPLINVAFYFYEGGVSAISATIRENIEKGYCKYLSERDTTGKVAIICSAKFDQKIDDTLMTLFNNTAQPSIAPSSGKSDSENNAEMSGLMKDLAKTIEKQQENKSEDSGYKYVVGAVVGAILTGIGAFFCAKKGEKAVVLPPHTPKPSGNGDGDGDGAYKVSPGGTKRWVATPGGRLESTEGAPKAPPTASRRGRKKQQDDEDQNNDFSDTFFLLGGGSENILITTKLDVFKILDELNKFFACMSSANCISDKLFGDKVVDAESLSTSSKDLSIILSDASILNTIQTPIVGELVITGNTIEVA